MPQRDPLGAAQQWFGRARRRRKSACPRDAPRHVRHATVTDRRRCPPRWHPQGTCRLALPVAAAPRAAAVRTAPRAVARHLGKRVAGNREKVRDALFFFGVPRPLVVARSRGCQGGSHLWHKDGTGRTWIHGGRGPPGPAGRRSTGARRPAGAVFFAVMCRAAPRADSASTSQNNEPPRCVVTSAT